MTTHAENNETKGSVKTLFEQLDRRRDQVLERARLCASVSLPSEMVQEGHTEDSDLETPYQSLIARGVNNLASKMLMSLLPTSTTFFRLKLDDSALILAEEAAKAASAQGMAVEAPAREDVENSLRELENKGMDIVENSTLRPIAHRALKASIVTGNALLYAPLKPEQPNRMFRLHQYVVRRDPAGRVMDIIVAENIDLSTLSEEVLMATETMPEGQSLETAQDGTKLPSVLYTHVKLDAQSKRHKWHQELNGHVVPGSEGSAREDESPWLALRWQAVENEDYGRGLVEEYLGDILSLESGMKAILQFGSAAAKILFLLRPGSAMDVDKLVDAISGDVITGNEEDVSILGLDKAQDFGVIKEIVADLTQRLSHAFLLHTGTIRDAERVTAEEVRANAQELEDAHGGVYSVQSVEFQMPLVRRILRIMRDSGEFPNFPKVKGKDVIKPTIVTGFEALGRGHELGRLRAFLRDLTELLPEERRRVNGDAAIRLLALSHNIDVKDIIYPDEQVRQSDEAAQQAARMDSAVPAMAGQATKGVVDALASDQ